MSGLSACRTPKEPTMLTFLLSLQAFLPQRLRRDDRGATAVEYGLIVALIAAAIAGALLILGGDISTVFGGIVKDL
jgi:pilus assembly protein Flp/PilA